MVDNFVAEGRDIEEVLLRPSAVAVDRPDRRKTGYAHIFSLDKYLR
jgi:hypothetical protein